MKKLTDYSKNGRRWYVADRLADVAIATDGQGHSEVFHVQSHNGRIINGATVEPAEYPPSNEQWGSLGWSFSDGVKARARFNQEVDKAQGRGQ